MILYHIIYNFLRHNKKITLKLEKYDEAKINHEKQLYLMTLEEK